MLKLTNTLTGTQETFVPADGSMVRMYTCGPTVYNYVHIGNLRTYVWEDVLRRHILSKGWKLRHILNITDIDDKSLGIGGNGSPLIVNKDLKAIYMILVKDGQRAWITMRPCT